ncbi:MAG: hypothetical protein ACTHMG_07410 [Sphingomonas sp.]
MSDDARKHWAQSTGDPVDGAPPGVRPISLDALNYLGVSDEGELYWIDTKVLTAKKQIRLTFWQSFGAILTVIAALIAAGAACISAYADFSALHVTERSGK